MSFTSILLNREGQSWEEDQLGMIAHDHKLLNSFQTLKYINIAFLTILVYDYCLTFDMERKRIWTLKWKLPKCIFMTNRYILPPVLFFEGFSNAMNVGHTICETRIFTPFISGTAIVTVEFMLILRVLALYRNSSTLARFLVIQCFVQVIGSCLVGGILLSRTRSIAGRKIFTGCLYDLPNEASLSWLPVFAIESILVILTVYKCRKYGEFTPTTKILARDSIIYFIGITSVVAFNIIYAHQHKLVMMTLALPVSVVNCIAAARLSMNIRAITVERGIATLLKETYFPTLSFLSRGSRDTGPGEDVSFPTGIITRQEELDDHECDEVGRREEQHDDSDSEAIREENRTIRTSANDVERAET